MQCAWQVEIDDYCNRVLEKHWPAVRRWRDVRDFPPEPVDEWKVDVICGGFPCQNVSNAGKREGIDGEQSSLWGEFDRVVRTLRPRIAVVENTTGLAVRGMQRVLGDLAGGGYDAEWDVLPASAFGAVHRRERIFILAYPAGVGLEGRIMRPREGEETTAALDRRRHWPAVSEPFGLRSADGIFGGMAGLRQRINALGNSVVPQVSQWIGERIIEALS